MTTLRDAIRNIKDENKQPINVIGLQDIAKRDCHLINFLNAVQPLGEDVEIKNVWTYNHYSTGAVHIIAGSFKTTFNEYAFFLKMDRNHYDLDFTKDYGYKYQFNHAQQTVKQQFFRELMALIDEGFEFEEFISAVDEKCGDEEFERSHNELMESIAEEDRINASMNY